MTGIPCAHRGTRGSAPRRAGFAPKGMSPVGGSSVQSMSVRGSGWTSTGIAVAVVLSVVLSTAIGSGSDPGNRVSKDTSPSAAARAATSGAGDPTWDNGVVQLTFQSLVPSFVVTSDNDSRVASTAALSDLAEVTPTGNVSAFARFQGPNSTWRFASVTSASGTVVWANGSIPVLPGSGPWSQDDGLSDNEDRLGNAHMDLSFFLRAPSGPSPNSVLFVVNMTHWPWVSSNDSLGVEMTSTSVGNTNLVPGTSPNQLLELRNGTSTTVAALSWDPQATVEQNGGITATSTVGTFRTFASGGANSTIRLEFGAVPGGYSGLSYDPTIVLNLGAFGNLLPAWQWSQVSLLVIALTSVLVLLLAAIARESRSRPVEVPEARRAAHAA